MPVFPVTLPAILSLAPSVRSQPDFIEEPTFDALAHGWLTGTLVVDVICTTCRRVSLPITRPSIGDITVGGVTLVACIA